MAETVKLLSEEELRALAIEPDGSALTLSHFIGGDQIPRLLAIARWAAKIHAAVTAEWNEAGYTGQGLCVEPCSICGIQAILRELTPPTPEERR